MGTRVWAVVLSAAVIAATTYCPCAAMAQKPAATQPAPPAAEHKCCAKKAETPKPATNPTKSCPECAARQQNVAERPAHNTGWLLKTFDATLAPILSFVAEIAPQTARVGTFTDVPIPPLLGDLYHMGCQLTI